MDNNEAIEKLQSIANQPEDSLKRFLAREILTYDSPQEFFSLVKDYGIETLYHYDDLEEHDLATFIRT